MELLIPFGGFAAVNALAALLIWQLLKAITASSEFRESDPHSDAIYPTRASGLLIAVFAFACLLFVMDHFAGEHQLTSPYERTAYLSLGLLCFYAVTFIVSSVKALKRPNLQSIYCAAHSALLGLLIFLFITVSLSSGSPA